MHFQSKQGQILVVDDDIQVARVLSGILQLAGHEVCIASSGEEALHVLESFVANIVVTDILMPGMGGIELSRRIRSTFKERNFFIISLSGWSDIEAQGVKGETFDLHFSKPVDYNKLAESIRFYLIALG